MQYLAVSFITLLLYAFKNKQIKNVFLNNHNEKTFNIKDDNKQQKISFIAIFILILFAGLRGKTVGYDTANYFKSIQQMQQYGNISYGHDYEFLFTLLNYLCMIVFGADIGFTVVLIISSLIILIFVNLTAKYFSPNITMTMFLFVSVDVYLRGFGQLRQGIAISILMFSLIYCVNKKPISFLACVFLAMQFHKTAIIFIIVYFIYNVKWKDYYYLFGLIIAIAFCIFNNQIIKFICDIFKFDYYDTYIKTGYGVQRFSIIGYLELFVYVIIFLFFWVFKKKYEQKHKLIGKNYNLFLNLFYFAILFYIIAFILQKPELFGRIIYYFFWSLIFLVPMFLDKLKNSYYYKTVSMFMLEIGMAYLIFSIFVIDAYGISNYQSVLKF